MNEELDLTSLSRAIASLREVLDGYAADSSNSMIRDSCIYRFERCYRVAIKMITRYLSMMAADPDEIRQMTVPRKIREAYALNIVKNSWDYWEIYREMYKNSAYAYEEETAIEIADSLEVFCKEMLFLLNALEERSKDEAEI